ncbi:nitric oxide-associated protein 1-like [Gigantopelta aegis]|uniref:nitric oxide-associated protein 1-like n=1 Tax=Gigantopelta aegis TaxID=1735272 RepID=UPI001B88D902|nr:nitric oxide-associated protein 1-like [Gigantopelta aegis]
MSIYVTLLRRVGLHYNNIVINKLIGIECLSQCVNPNTRSLAFGKISKKHTNSKTEQKDIKKVSKDTRSDSTPLVVKMLCDNLKEQHDIEQTDHLSHEKTTLSIDDLRQSLDDISWDVKARFKKELQDIDSINLAEEKSRMYSDLQQEDDFIEHIDLDGNTAPPSKKGKSHIMKNIIGTVDPAVPKTDIPCSGCGAILHCQDSSAPGFMSSEKLTVLTKDQLKQSVCQRCHLMMHHNICLNVRVDENEYAKIISKIKTSRGLIMVVVDLTDFPNSIFKNLMQHVGWSRPLYIIGNKVDLLARDDKGYLDRIKQSLIKECEASGLNPSGNNLRHVCLVSAKTGFGIEELVTKLMSQWQLKGHVFLVGCTNVGKSSLFNALLGSDYCKSHVRELIHRATVSTWPGTTVSLLKFPIVTPKVWRLQARMERLIEQRMRDAMEKKLRSLERDDQEGNEQKTSFKLTGNVGQTDFRSSKQKQAEEQCEYEGQEIVSFELTNRDTLETHSGRGEKVSPPDMSFDEKLTESRWTFDTPGVVNSEQIINLLSPEELAVVLPRPVIVPRVFVVKPSQVLFVSGLGRIDYVQGSKSIFLTVHCSANLPLHVVNGNEAEEFYSQRVGTKQLGVPLGLCDRVKSLPPLESKDVSVVGLNWEQAAADIQLSSLGWVSVTAGFEMSVTLRAYTPGGRGIYVRSPALLPHYRSFRGQRIGKTPVYRPKKHNS